jgi:hypothetical protein
MKTQRYVLRFLGAGPIHPDDISYFQSQLLVLDQSQHCLLVNSTADHLSQLLEEMPLWQAEPERMHQTQEPTTTPNPGSYQNLLLTAVMILVGLAILFPLAS